jgi:hypothetical protein
MQSSVGQNNKKRNAPARVQATKLSENTVRIDPSILTGYLQENCANFCRIRPALCIHEINWQAEKMPQYK